MDYRNKNFHFYTQHGNSYQTRIKIKHINLDFPFLYASIKKLTRVMLLVKESASYIHLGRKLKKKVQYTSQINYQQSDMVRSNIDEYIIQFTKS